MQFPSSWPQNCPPTNAGDPDGEVYRIVKTAPHDASDFLSYAEAGKVVQGRECACCGLSVFGKIEDARHYADKFPYLGSLFARARLQPAHGKIEASPRGGNSHLTWWPYEPVDRAALFQPGEP